MTSTEGATILIVDDDEDALQLLRMVMERSGYTVHTATNGLSALDALGEHGDAIEAIILDLMMPGDLDGYAVCDRLNDNPKTTRIPIIVLSAKSSARDMMRSYAAGAFQHITKPYDIQYLVAVVESMIRFRRLERNALRSAAKYRAIVDTTPLELLVVDPDLVIREMNSAFRAHYPDAAIGQSALDVCIQEEMREDHPIVVALRTGENQHARIETERGGHPFFGKIHAAPLRDEEGVLTGILSVTEDITEHCELEEKLRRQIERHNRALRQQDRISEHLMNVQRQLQQKSRELEKANQELERLSITDPLTGLYNRRYCDSVLVNEARRSSRYRHPLSLLMADIDHFKVVNDTHGHPVGDVVLRRIADILQERLRETDTVARYGGEEFLAILPETPSETAFQIAERLRETVEAAVTDADGKAIRITVSIGVATETSDAIDPEALLDRADEALYDAKQKGRNRVASGSPPHEHA